MPIGNKVLRVCSNCGYPAKDTDAAEFCPSCGKVGTFLSTTDDRSKDEIAA